MDTFYRISWDFRFACVGTNDYTSNPLYWNVFFIPSDTTGSRRGQFWLLLERKSLGLPHFKQFLRHLSVPPPSFDLFASPPPCLSGWHRQRPDPSKHGPKQPPRQDQVICNREDQEVPVRRILPDRCTLV
jgi:hypothetical protein